MIHRPLLQGTNNYVECRSRDHTVVVKGKKLTQPKHCEECSRGHVKEAPHSSCMAHVAIIRCNKDDVQITRNYVGESAVEDKPRITKVK